MTNNDDLLKRLEQAGDLLELWGYRSHAKATEQVAARIRELEAYTDTFSPYDVLGVREGTHVIVPVEPTKAALEAISDEIAGSDWEPSDETLRAVYRAAQGKQDG